MARLKTNNKGLVEWFDLHNTFDVGPAATGSARLLDNADNGPVMRIVQDRGSWKALAFPGTGYRIIVDRTDVQAGVPRILTYGASIAILRGEAVKFQATFEDADELEQRAGSLGRENQELREQLATRDRRNEVVATERTRLQERLAKAEAAAKRLEDALENLSAQFAALIRDHEQLAHEYVRVKAERGYLHEDCVHLRQIAEVRSEELERVRILCARLSHQLAEQDASRRHGAARAVDELGVLRQQYVELQQDRDRILEMYNECTDAMARLLETR
jgi:regulator of replication initiation timing